MTYQLMADDLKKFVLDHQLHAVHLLGHSMGAKTAMVFALRYPDLVKRLIIVDMAPRSYPPHHLKILSALRSLDLSLFKNRKDMESQLANSIPDSAVRRFLLKNVKRDASGAFYWQLNLAAIERNYERLNEAISHQRSSEKPALLVRGQRSDYVRDEDLASIHELFPRSEFCEIPSAGHWVHVDAPEPFLRNVREFLKR